MVNLNRWVIRRRTYHWVPSYGWSASGNKLKPGLCACGKGPPRARCLFIDFPASPPLGARVCEACAVAAVANALES
jgi:hypothetical protein